jgi:cytochrome P450
MMEDDLEPSIPKPDSAFGFGRRVCAGRDLAEASVWVTMMCLLATFEFKGKPGYKAKDYGSFTDGVVS